MGLFANEEEDEWNEDTKTRDEESWNEGR